MTQASVGRLAAENKKLDQIQTMRTSNDHFSQPVNNNPFEVNYWNVQFHTILGAMDHNTDLKPSYDRLLIDYVRIN